MLAGRFQVLPGNPRIVLDVSHNEEALLASLATLRDISPPQRSVLLFGVLARKELGRFPRRALRSAREVVLVPLKDEGSARTADLERLFAGAGSDGDRSRITVTRSMRDGIRYALGRLEPRDTLLVLGSHLTVEEAVGCL
jgi:folylpolyglutamate synthase/dihydropteroate synthase